VYRILLYLEGTHPPLWTSSSSDGPRQFLNTTMRSTLVTGAVFSGLAIAQTGVVKPLAESCNASLPKVVCINQYASVMPYHFFRAVSNGTSQPTFGSTSVPNDTSFGQVSSADFLVFDRKRGLELLGTNPSYEYVFHVDGAVHEAPVYVPAQNKLYLSQLAPPAGYLPQLVVDLNQNPPTLSEFLFDPPVYAPNGGTFHNGLVYWGASGGNSSIGGTEQRTGIRTLDPATNKTTTLLNNYFGGYFNTVDDLFVHSNGDVWFTDPRKKALTSRENTPSNLPLTRIFLVQQTHRHASPIRICLLPLPPLHRRRPHHRRHARPTQRHRNLTRRTHNLHLRYRRRLRPHRRLRRPAGRLLQRHGQTHDLRLRRRR